MLIFGLYPCYKDGGISMSTEMDALFNASHKTVWALSLAWIVYACSHGLVGKELLTNKESNKPNEKSDRFIHYAKSLVVLTLSTRNRVCFIKVKLIKVAQFSLSAV